MTVPDIKPKAGDVVGNGGIFIGDGRALMVGRALIHPSRLRRAKRFGWQEVPGARPHGLVEVKRESEKA